MTKHYLPFDTALSALEAAGESTRLRLLALLAEAELTVTELVTVLGQSQPRVSRHLKLLVEAGLVERHREGAWAFFRAAERGAVGRPSQQVDLHGGAYYTVGAEGMIPGACSASA